MNVASNIVPLLPDHLIAPPTPVEARLNLKTEAFITPRVLLSHETAPALTVAKLFRNVDLRILPSVVFSHLTAPPWLALLSLKYESMICDDAPWQYNAPPSPVALFFMNLECSTFPFAPSQYTAPPVVALFIVKLEYEIIEVVPVQ